MAQLIAVSPLLLTSSLSALALLLGWIGWRVYLRAKILAFVLRPHYAAVHVKTALRGRPLAENLNREIQALSDPKTPLPYQRFLVLGADGSGKTSVLIRVFARLYLQFPRKGPLPLLIHVPTVGAADPLAELTHNPKRVIWLDGLDETDSFLQDPTGTLDRWIQATSACAGLVITLSPHSWATLPDTAESTWRYTGREASALFAVRHLPALPPAPPISRKQGYKALRGLSNQTGFRAPPPYLLRWWQQA